MWLHARTGEGYARQILEEEKRKDRRGKISGVRVRKDNHLLDCEVYAAAAVEWAPSLVYIVGQMDGRKAVENSKPAVKKEPDGYKASEKGRDRKW